MTRTATARTMRCWHWDGRKIRPLSGGVPLTDRGFRYGQHLFESIAVRGGHALLGREHLTLLANSAREKGIPLSRQLGAALRRFLGAVSLPDGMLRVYLTAGPGAPGSTVRSSSCFLAWESSGFPTPSRIGKGISLRVLKQPFLGEGWGEKGGNYAAHLKAIERALAAGADEGIVLDGRGRVLSCAMGNLLVWMPPRKNAKGLSQGYVLCTPPQHRGARAGAVLGWVHSQAAVEERDLRPADLLRARAMAVTNSRLGVMPVSTLDGRKLPDPSLARTLAHDYLLRHDLLGNA